MRRGTSHFGGAAPATGERLAVIRVRTLAGGVAGFALVAAVAAGPDPAFGAIINGWRTVVNNTVSVPGDADPLQRNFNSYNQPSVNSAGLVVFRARSKGGAGSGEPASGIFTRDMSGPANPLNTIASRQSVAPAPAYVPQPGYTYAPTGATFNEFPAIPRIDTGSSSIATRGQTPPVMEITDAAGVKTKIGTSAIYTNPGGALTSGVMNFTLLGFDAYQVPGQPAGTKFDQFPGSPSITDTSKIVFKGNFAGGTGVYWRDVSNPANPVVRIADTTTAGTDFAGGSTAPPSAAKGSAVFLGVDNEDKPTKGGIYLAPLVLSPALTKLVGIGDTAQGFGDLLENERKLTRIGEALSFDGRYLAYWGAVGTATRLVTLRCPSDGNADVRAACLAQDQNGTAGDGEYTFEVAANQGIFLTDTLAPGGPLTTLLARTGSAPGDFLDFVYWGFSGHPPGVGGGDEPIDGEPPRWRSTSFVAVDGGRVAFKGTTNDGLFGLYLADGASPLLTLARQGDDGSLLDPAAAGMPITALGIERDGFRNGWLAISASMANDEAGMAGVYVTNVPEPGTIALMLAGLGWATAGWTGRRRAGNCRGAPPPAIRSGP